MTTPLLECKDLSICYRNREGVAAAVRRFNCVVMPGETHGIVGESGCGKSTVAMGIVRYLGRGGEIAGGKILFDGRDVTAMDRPELRRLRGREIGVVYQDPLSALNPSMRIGAQLLEAATAHDKNRDARGSVREMLASVQLADADRIIASYPHQLSGGQQQRIVIAMALLGRPRLLILDEPTTALDVTVEAAIMGLIASLTRAHAVTVLQISHNLGLIAETCQRVTVMYAGEAVETGPVRELFGAPRHPYTQGLVASIASPGLSRANQRLEPIPGQAPSPLRMPSSCGFGPRCNHLLAGLCDVGPIEMQPVGEGRAVRCIRVELIPPRLSRKPGEPELAPSSEPLLVAKGVTKRYARTSAFPRIGRKIPGVVANNDVSLDLHHGETLALVGESGSGKSTFARIVMGLEEADEGHLVFDGKDLARQPVRRRDRTLIGRLQMIFQNPAGMLNPARTIGAQLTRSVVLADRTATADVVRSRVRTLIDMVKLPHDVLRQRPRQLSGGQKQRVAIARAFAGRPSLVVADEPLSALDVSVQAAIAGLLNDIRRKNGTALLFVSHDLAIVRYLADRIVVLYLGEVLESGTTEEIFAPPYHPYTEGLLSAIPLLEVDLEKRHIVVGLDAPAPAAQRAGCPFSPRCPSAIRGLCDTTPAPVHRFSPTHEIACHLQREVLRNARPVIYRKCSP